MGFAFMLIFSAMNLASVQTNTPASNWICHLTLEPSFLFNFILL